jgi:hypothetical protein
MNGQRDKKLHTNTHAAEQVIPTKKIYTVVFGQRDDSPQAKY